jgi:hypothetical protein
MKRFLFSTTAVLVAVFLFVPRVVGQDAPEITLSLSPQIFDISANPGEEISNSFRIVNGEDREIALKTSVKNFTVGDEEGGVELTDEETNWSLASWVTVSPTEISLDPLGSKIFDFTIEVPIGAEPGSHFGAIIVRTDAAELNQTGPSVAQEIGPLILVKVAGEVVEGAEIDSFGSTRTFWFTGPVRVETRLKNTGNVHFKPSGSITIKNTFGGEVTTLNLSEQNVLPDSIRSLVDEWDPGVFAFGRYTADLSMVYGSDDTILIASTSFYVFPVLMSVLVIGGIVFLVVVIRGRRRLGKAFGALTGR